MALRLTSKSQGIHASATKAFAKRYFTDVHLLYNRYSLETFVKICQHHIFGPSIRRVQLSSARFKKNHFYETVGDLMEDEYNTHSEFSDLIQRLAERCVATYNDPEVIAPLEQAFGLVAKSDHSLVLAAATDEEKTLGCSKVWSASNISMDHCSADSLDALDTLLKAADKSGCRVHGLEIQTAVDLDQAMLEYLADEWEEWEVVCSLTELKFDLPVGIHRFGDQEDYGAFHELLSLTTGLKTLHIRSGLFPQDVDAFVVLAEPISCLPLEELHLTSLRLSRGTVTDLLEDLGPTLRRLKISKCEITGSWKQVLLSIQQHNLELDELIVSTTKRPWWTGTAAYKSITNVRSGVAKLLQDRAAFYRKFWGMFDSDRE